MEKAFEEYWQNEWPDITKNKKILESSAVYKFTKSAFEAGFNAGLEAGLIAGGNHTSYDCTVKMDAQ